MDRRQAHRLIELAVSEFAPDWEVVGDCEPLSLRGPNDWMSGTASFGVTLRNRRSGDVRAVGRRQGGPPGASYHRGLSVRVVEAYAERNTDPMWRFLQEIGVAPVSRGSGPRLAVGTDRLSFSPVLRPGPASPLSGPPRPAAPRAPEPPPPPRPAVTSQRWGGSAPATRGRPGRFLRLGPGPVRRLIERARPRPVPPAGGRVAAAQPLLTLGRVSPQLSDDGSTIWVELSVAQGRGRIVLECSRVVDASLDGETGERAVAAILAAIGAQH